MLKISYLHRQNLMISPYLYPRLQTKEKKRKKLKNYFCYFALLFDFDFVVLFWKVFVLFILNASTQINNVLIENIKITETQEQENYLML